MNVDFISLVIYIDLQVLVNLLSLSFYVCKVHIVTYFRYLYGKSHDLCMESYLPQCLNLILIQSN